MNSEVKTAWFTIVIISLTLICWGFMQVKFGFPVSFAAMSIMGLLGLPPLLFRKSRDGADLDERDVEIVRKASLFGANCSYIVFGLSAMGIWFAMYRQGRGQIDIEALPMLAMWSALVLFLVRSLYIVSQYPRNLPES